MMEEDQANIKRKLLNFVVEDMEIEVYEDYWTEDDIKAAIGELGWMWPITECLLAKPKAIPACYLDFQGNLPFNPLLELVRQKLFFTRCLEHDPTIRPANIVMGLKGDEIGFFLDRQAAQGSEWKDTCDQICSALSDRLGWTLVRRIDQNPNSCWLYFVPTDKEAFRMQLYDAEVHHLIKDVDTVIEKMCRDHAYEELQGSELHAIEMALVDYHHKVFPDESGEDE